ncbi:hypothetical protein LTR17_021634 [Elasticomyces elasticus]|nr:hypothetical protein LTR17_021634 [Elasticomyces elasticus]
MPATDLGRDKTPQWPEFGVPSDVKNLIDRFYNLVDIESEDSFLEGIDQFTTEGFTEINEKIVRGHADLLLERRASWNKIAARKHNTYRVYVTDAACLDLLVIGRNDVECRNGEHFSQEYVQNFLLRRDQSGRLLIRKFQAWVDFSSLKEALSGL